MGRHNSQTAERGSIGFWTDLGSRASIGGNLRKTAKANCFTLANFAVHSPTDSINSIAAGNQNHYLGRRPHCPHPLRPFQRRTAAADERTVWMRESRPPSLRSPNYDET